MISAKERSIENYMIYKYDSSGHTQTIHLLWDFVAFITIGIGSTKSHVVSKQEVLSSNIYMPYLVPQLNMSIYDTSQKNQIKNEGES